MTFSYCFSSHNELVVELNRLETVRLQNNSKISLSSLASNSNSASPESDSSIKSRSKNVDSDTNNILNDSNNSFLHNFDLFNYNDSSNGKTLLSDSGTGIDPKANEQFVLENGSSNPMLSNALSPNSDSNRSHDGVFLRPGAVYTR